MERKQLVVLGAGPGGYAAAFLAADLGLEVALIDKAENPGGVCLYRGCIPSKALLHSAEVINSAKEASAFGITFSEPQIDIEKLRVWKDDVVRKLTSGLGQLTRQRKIEYICGTGKFVSNNLIEVIVKGGSKREIAFENAIIATGSSITEIPAFNLNSSSILNSTTALELTDIPKNMLIVGGGYIGLELGSVYAALGCRITVVEMLPRILAGADPDLTAVLQRSLTKKFERILTSTKVTGASISNDGISVKMEGEKGNSIEEVFEKVLVSVGRKPVTAGLGLENTGVKTDEKGFIVTDEQRRTSVKNIFAVGDIAGEPMLAHKASHEGRFAAEVIYGHKAVYEPKAVPSVVFTDPEIAWTGLTEEEAKKKGISYAVTKFPWAASGRALTLGKPDGLTKLIFDPETERLLGIGIAGPNAGELIAEGVLALEMGANAIDIKLSIHPHPSLSETIMESAEMFFGQSTSIYRPKK